MPPQRLSGLDETRPNWAVSELLTEIMPSLLEVLLDAIAVIPFCRGHGSDSTGQPADAALLWVLGDILSLPLLGLGRPVGLSCAAMVNDTLLGRRHKRTWVLCALVAFAAGVESYLRPR